jgi:predicted Holliday junction resolvase-like endonuclease
MDNIGILFILFAAMLLIVAILAVVIGYFWASSRTKSALLREMQEQGDAIRKEAQDQLQNWKDQELAAIRQQTHEAAKGQAIQEMQGQIQNWQETELQQVRQQALDAAKGQAIQEMQEQMRSWQENELQLIRKQIFDAARGQSTQEATEMVQRWQQTELQVIRKQLSEALRGEAIGEAQAQLLKWRTEELEKAKSQIWDVLSKDAAVSLEQWKTEFEKEIRQDAVNKSQSVTMGKMTEHIVPYLPGFGFNPSDARFIGSPIDLLVFDGLDEDCLKKIVFIEIKTGNSALSPRERLVRDAILAKNIEWRQVKVNLENPDVVHPVRSRKTVSI